MADEELFDPKEHTVPDVNDYLAGQHPDEVARVLEEERMGFDRKGILEGPHAAQVEATEPEAVEDSIGDHDPYELVRAKDVAGNEYTTSRVAALSAGSTVLDKPARDQFGEPFPTKTVLDFRAEATSAGESSDDPSSKE